MDGKPIAEVENLQEFQEKFREIPADALLYHGKRNSFSTWLMARGEINMADRLRPVKTEDFESADFGFAKIPASMKPEGDANAARLTVMLPINDNLVGNIASDPATGKLTSITATVGANEDAAENLKNFSSAALMLSAADGDDGNKTIGGKIIKMAGDAVNEFAKQAEKDSTASVNKNFVENGVKYGILVSGSMPVMMFAEPAENK